MDDTELAYASGAPLTGAVAVHCIRVSQPPSLATASLRTPTRLHTFRTTRLAAQLFKE